jgi:hypothetical protein
MKTNMPVMKAGATTLGLLLAMAITSAAQTSPAPALILLNADHLQKARTRMNAHDVTLKPALDALLKDAAKALKIPPASVMEKTKTPPSGDKHDFMSYGPYWWPDPAKTNGLPYIRRDGSVNPEIRNGEASDDPRMGRMAGAVSTLALAFYFTREEKYAEHAAQLLRVWFLNPATRMNPNLNYGQGIPGICDGRGIGIIDSVCLLGVPDANILLGKSKSWTAMDQRGLRTWFANYLNWLLTSKNGKDEAAAENNHGTWYDAQVSTFALYVDQLEVARQTLEQAKSKRIARQIQPDGRQPHELARTKSFGYSQMNLNGMLTLGVLGQRVGIDLLRYETPDGRSIRRALNYLMQYADEAKKWPYEQLQGYRPADLHDTALRAASLYQDDTLLKLAGKLSGPKQRESRMHLQLNQ